MKIFKNRHELKKAIHNEKRISFIPTMGGLHKGHLSLIKKAQKLRGKILVSIFVNPKQFNDKKDYLKYPRNLKKDLNYLKKNKVDYLFLPSGKNIFNFKPKKKIFLHKFSEKLCGRHRKGHFKGVLDIINRFLEVIKPKFLLLGEKDFQQLFLVNKHIIKNKIKSKVIPCKTIRESNGIACSSRNKKLTKKQLKIASDIYFFLKANKRKLIFFKNNLMKEMHQFGINKIDYIELLNLKTLKKPKNNKEKYNIFIAYYLNKTRLIDNF